jgi:hypothetical protein
MRRFADCLWPDFDEHASDVRSMNAVAPEALWDTCREEAFEVYDITAPA